MKKILLLFLFILGFANSVKISYDPDYAPFSYQDKNSNKPYGLLIDIYKEWGKVTGNKIIFVNGKTWKNAIELAKKGKVDYFLGTDPYEKWMKPCIPIYQTSTGFFTLKSYEGNYKKIGIIGDDYREDMHKLFPKAQIISYNTYYMLLKSLINKKIDVIYDDTIAIDYFTLQKHYYHLLKKVAKYSVKSLINPITNSEKKVKLFNKGFEKIPLNKLIKIEKFWIMNKDDRYYSETNKITLTKEEKEWTKQTGFIKLAVMNYWSSDDQNRNLHTEIIKLLSKYSGLKIVPIYFNSWKQGYEQAKNGKINGIMNLSYSKKREKYFYYLPAYNFTPIYLITKKYFDIKSLKNVKTILVKSKTITVQMIKKLYPNIKIIEVDTVDNMYKKLANSNIDAMVTFFKKDDLLKKYNLKVAKSIYNRYGEISIGINRKYPELYHILLKTFIAIPKSKIIDLRDKKWEKTKLNLYNIKGINIFNLLTIEQKIGLLILVLLLIFLFYTVFYKKSKFLNIKISTLLKSFLGVEVIVTIFILYSIINLYSLGENLTKAQNHLITLEKEHNNTAKRVQENQMQYIQLNIRANFFYLLMIITIFLFLNILFYFIFKLKIGKPLLYLTNSINRLKEDKKIEKKEFFNDEIGEVIANFFKMSKVLQEQKKHIKSSIDYAYLIQEKILPDENLLKKHFKDEFVIWKPKDVVGGDIWLFDELNENESILFIMDCTGHGVSGAFVTMLVKAIETEIIANIKQQKIEEINLAEIMQYFNRKIKTLLQQTSKKSKSNTGLDGGIFYYNKKEKLGKFVGAKMSFFYNEDKKIKEIKGNRYSVGYKDCKIDYEYTEHILNLKENMSIYLTTDGYLDQSGGKKGFSFGKRHFVKLLEKNFDKPMKVQKEILLEELKKWQGNEITNDDITVIGLKI
jgi:ABC-type amino acid transport substrate-binding protein/serine phosphatase RsbU (regulator of sigma subunit)